MTIKRKRNARADTAVEAGDAVATSLQLAVSARPAVVALAVVVRRRVVRCASVDFETFAVTRARVLKAVIHCKYSSKTLSLTDLLVNKTTETHLCHLFKHFFGV